VKTPLNFIALGGWRKAWIRFS